MEKGLGQSQVDLFDNEESEVETDEENDVKKSETEQSPVSEKPRKRSKWRKLTSQKDNNSRKEKGKEKMKSKGKENIEMSEMNDEEKVKDNRKSLSRLNSKDRGLFKRPSLKDYRKKWKKEGRRIESPVSSPKMKEVVTKYRNELTTNKNNNHQIEDERIRAKRPIKTTDVSDSPQITTFEQNLTWARRAFFMSTEKIFPGFIRNYGLRSNSRSRDPTGVKLRTSIPLKMCLLAHSYFVPIWFIAFLCLQEFAATSLKPLHNYVHSCLTYVCMVTDALRLYAGFVSNTRDDMQLLALYWMATVILQTPMMCFIFATHSFSVHVLILMSTMDIILGSILLLEIWFGFWQLRGLVNSEMNFLHMSRQMNEHMSQMKIMNDHGQNRQPRVINSAEKGPSLNWSSSSDDNNSDNKDSPNKSVLTAKQIRTHDD